VTPPPSTRARWVATTVREVFGGDCRVRRYWDDPHEHHIDIATCDSEASDESSLSTVGLSDYLAESTSGWKGSVELAAACRSQYESVVAHALATSAFNIAKHSWRIGPGSTVPDVLGRYDSALPMRHWFFKPPFAWGDRLIEEASPDGEPVRWLMAVAISESELRFAERHGIEALDEALGEANSDYLGLNRDEIV
jgi:hypothetical protein